MLSLVAAADFCGAAPALADDPEPAGPLARLRDLVVDSRYDEALAEGAAQLEQLSSRTGDQRLEEAWILDQLTVAAYHGSGVMEPRALERAQRAVALKEAVTGPESAETATSLTHLANLHYGRREFAEALTGYERALTLLTAIHGPDHATVASVLNSQSLVLRRQGRFAPARELAECALAIQERVLGPDQADLARTLNTLGLIHLMLGDYRQTLACHQRALSIRERVWGPDSEWVAESLNNLSTVLSYLGHFDEALVAQERAVAILTAVLGPDHHRTWWASLNLGINYLDMGDYEGAVPRCEQVLAAFRARYGDDHSELTYALDALAAAHFGAGRFERALAYYQESLRICDAAFGADNVEGANTLEEIGRCLGELGRLDEALASLERSLQLREAALGPDSSELSELLNRLAEVHLKRGAWEAALAAAGRSREILLHNLGAEHPMLAEARLLEARALAGADRGAEAFEAALQAEAISRRHLQETIQVLAESHALGYATTRAVGLDLAMSLLAPAERGARVARVWDALLRSRSLVLDETRARNRRREAPDGQPGSGLAEAALALRSRLANLILRGPGWEPVADYRELIRATRQELAATERQLALATPAGPAGVGEGEIDLPRVRQALAPDAALVTYARYQRPAGGPAAYRAFVLTGSGGDPVSLALGEAQLVESRVSAWHDQVSLGGRPLPDAAGESVAAVRGLARVARDPGARLEDCRAAGAALRETVWDPLVPLLGGSARVFLVPDGSLHLVSFAALPVGADRFLVEDGPLVHALVAERSLCRTSAPIDPQLGLLLVGDPAYGPAGARSASVAVAERPTRAGMPLDVARFIPLPASRTEVEALARLWCALPGLGADRVALLTGAAATQAALEQALPRARILHLATHGFFQADDGGSVGGHVAPWRRAMALSGLALAGANGWREAAAGGDDGILTAEEVSVCDLSHLEWAVLSACDTGRGLLEAPGEGLFGLRRAFLQAGARTVIMSLWAVDDQDARDWMIALYSARLRDGLAAAEAVREASRAVLAERRAAGASVHPCHWAGFVAAGDWR